MKEKVKIWSRRRLLGAFLAFLGLSAVATAQNGTRKANCGSELAVVTKTVNQLNDDNGTSITLNFTGMVNAGDEYFFVADNGGGAFKSIICNENIGKNIEIIDDGYTEGDYIDLSTPILDDISVPSRAAGVFTVTDGNINPITITLKYNDGNDGIASDITTLYLGVFVKDAGTGCYSDVNWIRIETELNIYAALTLRNDGTDNVPYEYICNGGTTATNLGFTLCNLPADGTLKYKVKATSSQVSESYIISGQLLNASAGTVAESGTLANTGDATNVITKSITRGTDAAHTALVEIGNQTLINANAAVAGTMVFSFVEMTYTYRGDIGGTQGDITLPIVFETEQSHCNPSINDTYPTEFTVYVAPSFKVQALAYAAGNERPTIGNDGSYAPGSGYDNTNSVFTATTTLSEPTFCQGTIAYLFGETSASDGVTTYAWANSTDPAAANEATITDLAIQNPNTAELTEFGNNAYTLLLTGTWNDLETGGHYGAGCQITDLMPINVTAAPILLLATDQAEVDGIQTWNATDIITAPEQCPGTPIFISTDKGGTPVTDGTGRTDAINAGNFIKHNESNISWYVTTDADAAAYTAWRSGEITAVDETSASTIGANDTDDDTDLTHYFDNSNNATPAVVKNVTYTLYNASGCKLVKSDGSSLTGGKVQIVFPVEPRPQFQLGAN